MAAYVPRGARASKKKVRGRKPSRAKKAEAKKRKIAKPQAKLGKKKAPSSKPKKRLTRKSVRKKVPAAQKRRRVASVRQKSTTRKPSAAELKARKAAQLARARKRKRASRKKEQARKQAVLDELEKKKQRARGKKDKHRRKKSHKKKRAEVERREFAEKKPRTKVEQARRELDRRALFEHRKSRFPELLKKARKAGQMHATDRRQRRILSAENVGERRVVGIDQEVREDTVEDILYKIRRAVKTMGGEYPVWHGVFELATMGEGLVGYGHRVLRIDDPDAADFTMAVDSTGIWRSAEGMLQKAEQMLNEYAGEHMTVVWLDDFVIQNFKRRT